MTSLLGSLGVGAIIGGGIIYQFIKSFIPSYLSEKAKNLASKEDIKGITEKVESVKSDYAHLLEEVRSSYQLKFAAVEREKSIKKEVYMEAVEAITRSQNIITAFCNLSLSEEQISSSMIVDAGKVAKIQVVGSKETVGAVNDYMAEIGMTSLDLMLKRSELILRKSSIYTYESLQNKSQQEIERYLAIMKNLNLQSNTDQALWGTINRNIEYEQGQLDKYQSELGSLWESQNKEHLKFTRECMRKFFDISLLLPAAILAVREELNLEIEREDYLRIYNENIDKGRRVFDEFLYRVEQENI
ncbi:hypothetical protein [Pseudomonas fluorescens]|uniref:hypothetical protein n=1 Tax=Pseudomonas fluorescens TaxID=294 RepID=UPI001CD6C08E|nr:hypothetical protein [Pseudomonas fluorescens]